ncbi:methyltransferase domain-containing protein [uncultured Clostridium sp.]|uniref:MerR family transcriptional regulator n=1 Tax=uncultured Clostridium sp. TaxID=59620 RepID=UPI0028E3644B|nr:methyltransferase domain-containing protein [uncultured Clostridium sp.]
MYKEDEELYTVGQFAKKAGVTIRTLRFYDKISLLKPSNYSELGYRLYNKQDFGRLQKILTLKFIGLSLEEIGDIMKYDIDDNDFKKSLNIQKKIIEEKIQHMFNVLKAIDETLVMVQKEDNLNWDKFINVINLINMDKKWIEQYKNASNLRARINIHEKFSSNAQGWMPWYFTKLNIAEEANILELGCGDGSLWLKNIDKVPKSWNISLTDFSQGMLNDTRNNLEKWENRFNFAVVDAHDLPYSDGSFDIIIANHMLYHLGDLHKSLSEVKRVLKPGGQFYASTVGKNHMKEMRDIIAQVDKSLLDMEGFTLTEKFQLENGEDILKSWFRDIEMDRYEDSLMVTESSAIMDYIFSMPGNIKNNFSKDKFTKLEDKMKKIIKEKGNIYISKDTGFFKAIK